jgi:hypothetical protein
VRGPLLAAAVLGCSASGCSVGEGDGFVHSDVLFVNECYRGEFNLQPDFFGANPYDDTLTIRIQRGQQEIQVSDGLTLLVNQLSYARMHLGEALSVGLPVGVAPLGYPLPATPMPPDASLSLYLNSSCRSQNSVLTAYRGTVTFNQLFSGNLNEENAVNRVTQGTFDVWVVDTHDAVPRDSSDGGPAYDFPEERSSEITGAFNFVFHRGTPAQPFP